MKISTLSLPLILCCLASTVQAGNEDFALCAKKYPDNNTERLNCYDQAAAQVPIPTAAQGHNEAASAAPAVPRTYLTKTWILDDINDLDESKLGRLKPHRQSYLIVRKTSNSNILPTSPAIGHTTLTPNDLDTLETKFQLSFKKDIGSQQDIDIGDFKTLRIWAAYTQQSNWQVLNSRNSSPFRETNYEPELIATFGTGAASGLKLVNLGWAHQSDGHRVPESRSWNRLYLQGGWEWDNVSIMGRGWWRIPENSLKDDNPDISDYIGRADLTARWEPADKSQAVAVLLRNNLRWPQNRGFAQIDWSTPISLGNAVRVYVQATSGFGESLIDYNHRQNTLGMGFSFREW